MRKILISLILILALICTVLLIVKGASIGKIQIWGINQIKDENELIDTKNERLSQLVSVTYPASLESLNSSANIMKKTKKEYEDKEKIMKDTTFYMQTEEYEIEFLWTKLGNHARKNSVEIKIDVTQSQIEGRYNLNFTVIGQYSDITQFIYDIENDSKLGFKIEDFSMNSNGESITGSFSCKEIKINLQYAEQSETQQEETSVEQENTEENQNKSQNEEN